MILDDLNKNLSDDQVNKIKLREKHYIIGIGASAGGLEAIHELFDYIPNNSYLSYIIVQHLSPDYKSLMAELLTKHTQMKVSEAEDGMLIQPNCVYVIPSKKNMTIRHGKLRLTDKLTSEIPNNAIDRFFESLAEDKGPQSIVIILSGTGTDGTKGAKAVKNSGGLVIVQDPVTAKFDGMPNSIINSGYADLMLPPELMGEEILNYVASGSLTKTPIDLIAKEDESVLLEILQMIKNQTSHDFTSYKRHTISRRILKRMAYLNIESLKQYLNFLYNNQTEINRLGQEFLIGVTKFFRDNEAFEIIKSNVIPDILKEKGPSDQVKIWVAACSTGEEAYSIAILLNEHLLSLNRHLNVKIFATDVDLEAINFAAKSTYPLSIAKDIPTEYLDKYFLREGNRYIVNQHIRKMVIFAHHNIIKDPPFSKLDMVSCRNLLIYMNNYLQKKVLSTLHFSLNKGGYLLLGSSENIGELKGALTEVNKKWNIYKTNKVAQNFIFQPEVGSKTEVRRKVDLPSQIKQGKDFFQNKMNDVFTETVLDEFGYAGIYIDEDLNIIQAIGNYKKYIELPEKKLQMNLLKMVSHDLSVALSVAIRKAVRNDQKVVSKNIRLTSKNSEKFITIIVKPSVSTSTNFSKKFIFIILIPDKTLKTKAKEKAIVIDQIHYERLEDLESELKETRENLHRAVEELETSNEELQSNNEELLSSNEELQSTNEELQSLNEELHTVNTEHQLKIKELIELNDDFNNYFRSTDIGQIFIDKNLIIRKYTPAIEKHINIIPSDIGRPISHFTFNINDDHIINNLIDVINTSKGVEKEIQTKNGSTFIMKIIPYIRQDKNTDGVVLTFVDITTSKYLHNVISGVLNSSQSSIMALKAIFNEEQEVIDFEWMLANDITKTILKKSPIELVGERLTHIFPGFVKDKILTRLIDVYKNEKVLHLEHKYQHDDIDAWLDIVTVKIDKGIALTISNINEKKLAAEKVIIAYQNLKEAEESLKKLNNNLEKRVRERTKELSISDERFRLLSQATNDAVWDWNLVDNKVWWNEAFKNIFGYESRIVEPGIESLFNHIHEEDKVRVIDGLNKVINNGEEQWTDEYRFIKFDGTSAFVYNRGYVLHNEYGMPYRMLGSMVDLTNFKKIQEELRHSNENLIKINNDLDNFVYTASHDLKAPIVNLESLIHHLKTRIKQKLDKDEVNMLEMIDMSILKFNKTIKALTEITKVQKDQLSIIEKIKFKEVLQDIKLDLSAIIEESDATIHTDFEADYIYFTKINLRSILYNLLSNAIKYRSPQRNPVIKIKTSREGKYITLSIEDNGLGLNENQLEKLFTMFKRFHSHVDGTGIGLYIVKRIIENKDGKIEVSSEKGKGTTFKIYFQDLEKKYQANMITVKN